jgi:two-component system, NtrC family, response regulator PilR
MSQAVLVVEDEADLLVTYERLLHRWGYRVSAATSLATALWTLERDRPDLVISDLRLPDGDGLQLVRAARAGPSPPPILIVTGVPSEDRRRAAMTAGVVGFLAKPFKSSTLQQLVQSALAYPPC